MYTYHVNAIPAGFYDKNLIMDFGKLFSITRERTEVIIQGTHDRPDNPNTAWREYEFKCKPGICKELFENNYFVKFVFYKFEKLK